MYDRSEMASGSILESYGMKFDYLDSFSVKLNRSDVQSWEPIAAFFQCTPRWIIAMFRMRNVAMRTFGLKGVLANLENMRPPFSKGARFGMFRLFDINENEGVLGEDDFHLNFRLSLRIDSRLTLHATTGVVFNNTFGNIYLSLVKPFHKVIVPSMLRRMANDINNRSLPQHGPC